MTGTPESDITPEADTTGTPDADSTPETDANGTAEADTTPETEMTGTAETAATPDDTIGEDNVTVFTMGERFMVSLPNMVTGVEVTVDGAMLIDSIEGAEPEAGRQFVGVSMTVQNLIVEPLPLVHFLALVSLMDEADERYPVSLQATASSMLDGRFEGNVIEPTDTVQGTVVFEVPEDAADLALVFDSDWVAAGDVAGEEFIMVELELTEN